MDINFFFKMFSSELKTKLLIHFHTCKCHANCVNDLVKKFGTSQANISKHLIQMEKAGILNYEIDHKIRIYKINDVFVKKWKNLLDIILQSDNMQEYACHCI